MLICVTPNDSQTPVAEELGTSGAQLVLDDPQEWSAFSEPMKSAAQRATSPDDRSSNEEWCSYISVEGMHCAACALQVEAALLGVSGVRRAEVDAASKRARVVWHAGVVQPSRWFEAVRAAGYVAIPAHDPVARLHRQAETRLVLWQWAVAGFCMMQVMMYAAPEYVQQGAEIPVDSLNLLHWAGWVLSLPVAVFSCMPYWKSAWHDLKARRMGMDLPVALGMAITFGLSTLATFEPMGWWGSTVYFDSFTMFVFFLLTGRWLSLRLRDRTAGALDEVLNRLPDAVERETARGDWETVGLKRLRVGDVVRVHPGDRFAADGVLLDDSTWVEEALLTGESRPQQRLRGQAVLAGSHNVSDRVRVRLTALGSDTRHAQIVGLMHDAALDKPRLVQLADRWAKPFLWAVLVAAVVAFLHGLTQSGSHAVMAAASVLIVTCPCALSLATPSALIAMAGRLAREGVLVRRLQVMESLAHIDAVVFDKTGTLTTGVAQNCTFWSSAHPQGLVWPQSGVQGFELETQRLLALVAEVAKSSAHPVSRALVNLVSQGSVSEPVVDASGKVHRVQELPGQGLVAEVQTGADTPVVTLVLGSWRHAQAAATGLSLPESVQAATVHVVLAGHWVMSLQWGEQLRPDAVATLMHLRQMGLEIHLLSGDRPERVRQVAAALGLPSDQAWGHCTPDDKLERLRTLQAKGHRLLMVGDGFNDMPVLAGADVSLAFGDAVALAQAHADVVVLGTRLGAVVDLVDGSRQTLSVIRGSLAWALIYNLVSVPLAVWGGLPPALAGLGMAASSLWVVMRALPLNKTLQPRSFVQDT